MGCKKMKRKGKILAGAGGIAGAVILMAVLIAGAISDEKQDNCTTPDGYSVGSIKGTAGDWTKSGTKANKTMKATWNFFKSKGFSGIAIAGICGNIAQESSFNTGASSNGSDIGIIQWTDNSDSSAKTALENWCRRHGKKVTSLDAQLEYLWTASSSAHTAHGMKNNSTLINGLKNAKSIEAATELFEQEVEAAGDPEMANRVSYAKQVYRMMGGSKVKGNSKLLKSKNAAAGDAADTADTSDCGDDDAAEGSGGPLLSIAKSLLGYFKYSQATRTRFGTIAHPNKNGTTDCSGFVWICMKKAGYPVPSYMFSTPVMESDAKGAHHYLKQIKPGQVRPGDVVIVNEGGGSGNSGHTAIVTTKYKGPHGYNTGIIQMTGPEGAGGVGKSTFRNGFLSLLGSGRVTWARPVNKKK